MKRFLALFLVFVLLTGFSSCDKEPPVSSLAESEITSEPSTISSEDEESQISSLTDDESSKEVEFSYITSTMDYFESYSFSLGSKEATVHYLFHEPIRDTGKDYPLVIYLHGLGATEQIVNKLINLENESEEYSVYTLVPSTPLHNEGWWTDLQLSAFKSLIRELVKEYNIDLERIYIMGISMGGMVTCRLVNELSPYTFAAAVPMSGTQNLSHPDALHSTAFRIYHAANDTTVGVSCSRTLYQQLTASGHPNVEYFELDSSSHSAPIYAAFGDNYREFFEWLFAQRLPTGQFSDFAW